MMIDFVNILVRECGFKKVDNESYSKKLFGGYDLIIRLCEDMEDEFYIYINSIDFGQIMFNLFMLQDGKYNYESKAHKYLGRKLRKDTSGNLAMGLIQYSKSGKETFLRNGGDYLSVKSFTSLIKKTNSVSKLFKYLYFSPLNNLVATIEGIWVYIYLSFETGVKSKEILINLRNGELSEDKLCCKLKRDIDLEIINEFKKNWDKLN